ncbi:MAG: 2-dehydropantoate 2-reductase [Porticoccaceae bacterium]
MKVCIFGGGAIGGYIAAAMARLPDVEISVVARGAQLAAIRKNGLRLITPAGDYTVPVTASDDPAQLGPQDYIFITVKENQLDGVVNTIAPLYHQDTAILPPTTGIPYWYFHGHPLYPERRLERMDPDGSKWDALDPARVIGCVYLTAATVTEPGVVAMEGGRGFALGEPSGEKSERVLRLSDAMERAGIAAPVVDENIRGWIWMKVISSLCWNTVSVLTCATIGEISASPAADIIRRMLAEADSVAAKFGVTMPRSGTERVGTVESNRSVPHHKASMLVDLERGKPLEIDVIADSIETMRDIAGVATPAIDMMLALTKLRALTAMRNAS